jgi:hypothetical protein
MNAARFLVQVTCVFAIAPALAASVSPGDPFYVRYGQSVELASGLKLKLIEVHEGRCGAGSTCVWQGEASVDIELQYKGQVASGSVTTEKPESTLLAHRVKLLHVYPAPRSGEQRPPKEYVAFLRVGSAAPTSAKAPANRAAALAAAGHHASAYTRAANDVCIDWQQRQLTSYISDSSDLCGTIGKVAPTAHAFHEDASMWRFYFLVDNPEMHTRDNQDLYLLVAISKAPRDALGRVVGAEVVLLPCEVTLLDETRAGCNSR